MTTRTITAYEHTCHQCGHTWTSKTQDPEKCVKCRSPFWNSPEKRKPGKRTTLTPEERKEKRRAYYQEYYRNRVKLHES